MKSEPSNNAAWHGMGPIGLILILTASLSAQQPAAPPAGPAGTPESLVENESLKTSPLGVRQQRVKRMLLDLETNFGELAKSLEKENPEQAQRLIEAFKKSKDFLLEQRMDDITALLDEMKLESADDEQNQVIRDLKALVDLLLSEENDLEKLAKEIEQLEAWRKSLEGLIQKEGELKDESDTLANKDDALAKLDAQIQKAQELAKKQDEISGETKDKAAKGPDELDPVAEKQGALSKESDQLAKELAEGEEKESDEPSQAPGAEAMKQAASQQRGARDQMEEGQTGQAQKSQEEARKRIEKAIEELKKERERVAKLSPEEAAKELAAEQNKTAKDAQGLGKQMAQSKRQGEETNPNAKAQEHVEQAKQNMDQAGQELSQSQPGQASPEQQKAKDELEKAKDEVERRLNELRDQAQQEQLAKLEEVFKAMLEKQKRATKATADLDKNREGEEKRLKRADRIALRKLAEDERGLEGDAGKAEALLVEDGTSVVFRDMVGWLAKELGNVSQLMEESRTDEFVQGSQREIETALEEFLKALENAQQQQAQNNKKQGQPGQGGQRQQSLLPPIAELKLLKLNQERINRRTKAFDQERAAKELNEGLRRQLDGVAAMQGKLTNMARLLATKFQPPTPGQGESNEID